VDRGWKLEVEGHEEPSVRSPELFPGFKYIALTVISYHHQLLGADWMLSRELGEVGPFGGLLADAMGLGKTLQTLATMVGNPPSKEDIKARTKATLIVLPASAIRQWTDEIEIHVDKGIFPKIMHYKAKKEIPLIFLQECDIVLTSQ
jgi:SNF2 family DNA or RNA helicase